MFRLYSYTHFFAMWSVCRLSSVITFMHGAKTVQRIWMPFDRYTCIVSHS